MADIFVSYTSEDRNLVKGIVAALEQAGYSVWWDRHIRLGTSFDREIERELESANCVVVVWSKYSIESDWVRNEAQEGLNRNVLVPLVIDGVQPPLAFRRAQALPISKQLSTAEMDEISSSVRKLVNPRHSDSDRHRPISENPPKPSIAVPLVATAVVVLSILGWVSFNGDQRTSKETVSLQDQSISTIAVLPLRNISGERDQDYFGNAISTEIWSKLSRVEGLQVISMTSSTAYRDRTMDIRDIGQELAANFIIEGSAARDGDHARINIHLIDSADGIELWGMQYRSEISTTASLFALYDQISAEVGTALGSRVTGTEVLHQPSSVPTEQIAAYNLIQLALFKFAESGDPRVMIPLVDQALELDESYADAWNVKGVTKRFEAEFGFVDARSGFEEARRYAHAALEIQPSHPYALTQLGDIAARVDLDFKKAMLAYNTAEDYGVGDADVAFAKGEIYLNTGRYDDAMREFERSAALDPGNVWPKMQIARLLNRMGRLQGSSTLFNQLVEEVPDNRFILQVALEHFLEHDIVRAEELINQSNKDVLPFWINAALAIHKGNEELARTKLPEWEAQRAKRYISPHIFANLYWHLREYDAHIRWWETAVEELAVLHFTFDIIARKPDYWETLETWVSEDSNLTSHRQELLQKHRKRIERVMKKMTL